MTQSPSGARAAWVQTPERSNMFMLRVMTWISLRLGRRVARLILHPITAYFLLFAPSGRRASRNYLRRALGRPPGWRDLYRHFFTFAATIHDRIYLVNRRFDLFELEVHGHDPLQSLLADGQGVFLMGAHLGSFEVIRALGWKHTDIPIAMLMNQEIANKLHTTLAAINPDAVQDIIALGEIQSMMKVRQRLEEGVIVGMLADRTPGTEATERVQLLDASAALPTGPFRLAALLKRPVVFMTGLYMGGNRYAIHFDILADFSATNSFERPAALQCALERYAELLDRYCRRAPYNWFNFYEFWSPATTSEVEHR